ncbi:MAG: hypothetical protein SFX19_04710 [Alphaproteobacteria bacterium]|nr:hypothetical protein [Alphaproteobacteria bacterium]
MNQLVPTANISKPDPQIEQSLSKTAEFLREYTPPPSAHKKDVLFDQYEIDLTRPLPQFNTGKARAFAATDNGDNKPLFALVCEPGTQQRHDAINRLLTVRNPNLCSLLAAGAVDLSQPAEERYVIFYEYVKGQKLSALLANTKGKIPPNIIITRIITPLVQAILALQEAGVTHGSINPDNIYYDQEAVLGPCVIDPCGYTQPYYYELVERMQAHPAGKGESNIDVDFYALAVLVLQILYGTQALERYPQVNLARAILRQGPFMALTAGREVPEEFFDFLWGMLGSGVNKRWNYRYLKPWLDGKHYNIIPSPAPTEGSKPYECLGTTAHSRREVAHMLATHWDRVKETLAESSLAYWVLITLRQKELSELLARHIKTIVESNNKNETQRNEHIMRLLLILDNEGPLRYSKISLHVDSIPALFADLYLKQAQDELQLLVKFIEQNLISAWVDLQSVKEIDIPEHLSQYFSRLDRLRGVIRNEGLGFGMERLLYDLNPAMPCLSPLCRGRHVTTLPDLLRHLDRIAPSMGASQDPIDVHIAAFVASKLGITNEIKLYDLSAIPVIANNKSLIALKLFAVAQHRSGNIELNGLTHWIAQRVLPSMQHLRSNTMRGRTLQMLLDEATEGRTQRLSDLLLDGEIINADQSGFQKALANYKRNADRIEAYKRGANLDFDSANLGGMIAKIFAYAALLLSVYNIFMAYQ